MQDRRTDLNENERCAGARTVEDKTERKIEKIDYEIYMVEEHLLKILYPRIEHFETRIT